MAQALSVHENGCYLVLKHLNTPQKFYYASARKPDGKCQKSLIQYELHNYASSCRIVAFAVTCDTSNIQDIRVHPYTLSGNPSGFYDGIFERGCTVDIKLLIVRTTDTFPTKESLEERVNRIREVLSQAITDDNMVAVNPPLNFSQACESGTIKLLTLALDLTGKLLEYDISDEIIDSEQEQKDVVKQRKQENDKVEEISHQSLQDASLKRIHDHDKSKFDESAAKVLKKLKSQDLFSPTQDEDYSFLREFKGRQITVNLFKTLFDNRWLDGQTIDFVLNVLIHKYSRGDVFLFACQHMSRIMLSDEKYMSLQLSQSEFPRSFSRYKYGVGVVHKVNHFKLVWIQFNSEKVSVLDSMSTPLQNLNDAHLVCDGLKKFFGMKSRLQQPEDLYSAAAPNEFNHFTAQGMPHAKYKFDDNNCGMVCIWHAKSLFGDPEYQLTRPISPQDIQNERTGTAAMILDLK